MRRFPILLILAGAAISLGGCIVAPAPSYYGPPGGYYAPRPPPPPYWHRW